MGDSQTVSDLIEAAARAMMPSAFATLDGGFTAQNAINQRRFLGAEKAVKRGRKLAERALSSTGIPLEQLAALASGEAWIAPNEPDLAMLFAGTTTDGMMAFGEAATVAVDLGYEMPTFAVPPLHQAWRAMRDASIQARFSLTGSATAPASLVGAPACKAGAPINPSAEGMREILQRQLDRPRLTPAPRPVTAAAVMDYPIPSPEEGKR